MTSKPHTSKALVPFFKVLLLIIGLSNCLRPSAVYAGGGVPVAVHGNGALTYTFTPIKDYSVIPNGVDEFEVSVSPTPPAGTQIFITFPVGGTSITESVGSVTDASGNAFFYLTNTTAGTVPVTIKDADNNIVGTIDMHFLA